jgi:hypothetical protein
MSNLSHKPFSQQDYKQNNPAIVVASGYLMSTGYYRYNDHPIEQSEKYKDYDFCLILKAGNRMISVEVERKRGWVKSGEWQGWPTMDVPARKKSSKADLFVMSNAPMDTLAICLMKDVLESPTYEKNTQCSTVKTENELFFAVNLEKVKFVKMKWEKING